MGKRCLLKSEYFSYKNFGTIAYVDIVDVVDMDFSVLRPKKWCLLTVLYSRCFKKQDLRRIKVIKVIKGGP